MILQELWFILLFLNILQSQLLLSLGIWYIIGYLRLLFISHNIRIHTYFNAFVMYETQNITNFIYFIFNINFIYTVLLTVYHFQTD